MFPKVKLGQIANVKGGKRIPKGKDLTTMPTPHPYIRGADIRGGKITFEDPVYLPEDVFPIIRRYVVYEGDVCLTIVGNIGDVGLVPNFLDGANLTENAVKLGDLHPDCYNVYLTYALLDTSVQKQMKLLAAGVAQPKLGIYKVNDVEIPFPPFDIQRRIANILSVYDDLIENNTRRIKLLGQAAHDLYREWFIYFRFPGHESVRMVDSGTENGVIPEGWRVGTLQDALILQRGFDLPIQQRRDGKVPVFASTGIVGTHDEVKVQAPGIVTGRSGSLGTVIYVEQDYWPLNTTLWVKEFRSATPFYAYYVLSDLHLEQFNSGAAVPTLNRNDIHGLPVIIPAIETLGLFDEQLQPIYDLKRNLTERNAILRETRDLLLPRLVSGDVDVSHFELLEENIL